MTDFRTAASIQLGWGTIETARTTDVWNNEVVEPEAIYTLHASSFKLKLNIYTISTHIDRTNSVTRVCESVLSGVAHGLSP